MHRRESWRLSTAIRQAGIPDGVAAEIHAAASPGPTRHRPRVTAEVARMHANRVVAGTALSADAFYQRVWGLGNVQPQKHNFGIRGELHCGCRPVCGAATRRPILRSLLGCGAPAASEVTVAPGNREQARQAVLAHVALWNAQDKESWLALFADDVLYEDPPGTVASRGRAVMSDYAWAGSFTEKKRWILEAVLVIACGHEAQVHMRNHGSVEGRPAWVDSIELWGVDDKGLVISVRAFWEPPKEQDLEQHLAMTTWQG